MGCDVSVLMPAYNEAENLVEVIPSTAAALDALGRSWEIIIVDDGSTDGTRTVMAGLRSANVRYIRLRRNSGKSAALEVGLNHVEGEYVVLMDADGQDDPDELPKMFAKLEEGYDLVTGRRRGPQRPLHQAQHLEDLQRRHGDGHRREDEGLQLRLQAHDP